MMSNNSPKDCVVHRIIGERDGILGKADRSAQVKRLQLRPDQKIAKDALDNLDATGLLCLYADHLLPAVNIELKNKKHD